MSIQCEQPAVTAATWINGQRLVLCMECYAKASQVANALGMALVVDALRDEETR